MKVIQSVGQNAKLLAQVDRNMYDRDIQSIVH